MLGHAHNLGESTIHNIKKNAEKNSNCYGPPTPLSAKVTKRVRNPLMQKKEKMHSLYTENEMKKKSSLGNLQFRSKTLKIYELL